MRLHRLFITLLLVSLVAEGALADDVIKVCGQNVQNFFYSLNSGMYYPWLYEYNDEPTGISTIANFSHPATTRKVMENGRISIIMPNGCSYTLQGIRKQ